MAEFGFRAGVYRDGTAEGPPEYVGAIEVSVEAADQDAAEEVAHDRISDLLAPGLQIDDELTPVG